MTPASPVEQLVDHLFRHRAGQMVATLTRVFGPAHLDLAEDVVQEALLAALRKWPFQGIPSNPGGWLIEVARNRAIDALRRLSHLRHKEEELRRWTAPITAAEAAIDEPDDDQLRMIFMCCNPTLTRESQLALTLKTLGGLSVREIARAFLCDEATIAQRLVRAKAHLRDERVAFAFPEPPELSRRLDVVLAVLYLIFNEGYAAHQGEELIRHELVGEALRLTGLLLTQPRTALPKVHALLALFLFQAARLPARVDPQGNLLLLEDQDRSLWDAPMIQRGFHHLQRAVGGDELTEYHLQAGIASCHARAATSAATDWPAILGWYDLLMRLKPSPVVALNRAVAVAMVHGPDAGLLEVAALADDPALERYYLLPATRAELLRRKGSLQEAAHWFSRAEALAESVPVRRFLRNRASARA